MALRDTTEAKLLDAAEDLLFTEGIAATPVDAVLARAGVSSATLYRGYRSKEALVAAVLERRHQRWATTWQDAVERAPDDRGRLLAVFDALDVMRADPAGARWCAFLGTAAEYPRPPAEITAAVQRDTELLRSRLTELSRPLVGPRAATLAEQLLLVVSGQLAMLLRDPGLDTAGARGVAATLLERA